MGKIRELTPLLTNQIAAGEVIERPASIVKELLENSIDAHSTNIEVYIEEAGLKSIRIVDDGEGMSNEDARLAIKRHTTSKLYTQDQLFKIRTLGFRGEALASIAAVSYVTLTTSTGEQEGIELSIRGGDIVSERAGSLRKGTTILVENIFFNTPARLKYVKTLQTELAHITDIVSKLSLSHPHISFSLYSDHHELLRTVGNGDLIQAIAGNIGAANARKMVAFQNENLDFKVSGYTSLPELTRSNRHYMMVFVNGRSIKNFAVNKAIVNGYGTALMVGRFPLTVISIEMDAFLVDVNVHPTKQEVRISKENELSLLIEEAIRSVIQKSVRIPSSHEKTFQKVVQKSPAYLQEQQVLDLSTTNYQTYAQDASSSYETVEEFKVEEHQTERGVEDTRIVKEATRTNNPFLLSKESENLKEVNVQQRSDKVLPEDVGTKEEKSSVFPELYYFGQMHGTYLFAQNQEGLYMIDQHAAQERIKYEQLKRQIALQVDQQQQLLIPIVFDFSKQDYLKLVDRLSTLESLHIFLEPFGQNSMQLQEHPSWIVAEDVKETVQMIVDRVLSDEKVTIEALREAAVIMMSCKQSIKANHRLSDELARQLLEDLALCDNPYNCPHGRPTIIHFTNRDMEQLFKRIQDSHQSKKYLSH